MDHAEQLSQSPLINGVPRNTEQHIKQHKYKLTRGKHIHSQYSDSLSGRSRSGIMDTFLFTSERTITDFRFFPSEDSQTAQSNQFHDMGAGVYGNTRKIQLEVKGKKAVIEYDKQLFDVETEIIPLTDPRLSNVWGKSICRITLTATNIHKTGNYSLP